MSLYKAEKIPKTTPINKAIQIDATASIAVLGNVSDIICETGLPDFANDSLKYGIFNKLPIVA